jgi:penicillin-binding protein 2
MLYSEKIRIKIKTIIISMICILAVITLRLMYLQIQHGSFFFEQGQKNFLRFEKIMPIRGNILDSNGVPLATNRPLVDLYWCGTGSTLDQKTMILKKLEIIFKKNFLTDFHIMSSLQYAERHHKTILLAKDLSFEQLSKIEEQLASERNILSFKTNFKRLYPYNSYASHIIGYLQYFGKTGLERYYEPILQGQEGVALKTINSFGKQIDSIEISSPLNGNNIQTTIDIRLQEIIENIFPKEKSGVFIVMDPIDGAIKAFLSHPQFDPSLFLQPITQKEWQKLQSKSPFINRGFESCYPPGSLFKLITTSAGLESNMISQETELDCNGFFYFGKRKYWCHKRQGHGHLTTMQAVAQSCNILFYEIGKKIDIDLLAQYGKKFGLGQKTGIIFPESAGLLPTRDWKIEHKGESWWQGETLSASIGQSFLLVTPIQIARMIASIFTGYLVRPRIVKDEQINRTPLNIAPETLSFLQQSMKSVVTKGTGKRINKIKDIEIYAKTSTAQTSSFEKRKLGPNYLEHSWFVAHITYKNQRPLTIVILIEHAGSSRVATLTAKKFLTQYKKLINKTKIK